MSKWNPNLLGIFLLLNTCRRLFLGYFLLAFLEQQVDLDSLTLAQPWFNTTNGLSWWWLRCGGRTEWGQMLGFESWGQTWPSELGEMEAVWHPHWDSVSSSVKWGLCFRIVMKTQGDEYGKECRGLHKSNSQLILLDLALKRPHTSPGPILLFYTSEN